MIVTLPGHVHLWFKDTNDNDTAEDDDDDDSLMEKIMLIRKLMSYI